ncbi:hypothetical protein PG984_003050 [Apiospora sp. TS-2023a]
MSDPLSIASAVAGLVSLTIQATQLTCKYVAEVNHAGDAVLQCLRSLSLLRDVLLRIHESSKDGSLASILMRKSQIFPKEDVERCEKSVETVRVRLAALFHENGKIKKRHAITWPFKNTESADLIKQLQGFQDIFATIIAADSLDVSVKSHQVAVETRSVVRDIKDDMANGRRDRATEALLDWIFPEDMERWRLGGDKAYWYQGTGAWAFASTEFLDWIESKDEKRRVLWCSGPPGSGKSALISQAISHIQEQLSPTSGSPKALVLSHFCDHRDSRTQSLDLIIRHLMRQAVLQSDTVLKELHKAKEYQEKERNGRGLHLEELMQIFLDKCLSSDPRFMIVLEGLDECTKDHTGLEARHDILQFINKAASTGTRVLTASRDLADIRTELCGCSFELKVRAPDADLRSYVTGRLRGIEKRVTRAESFKEAIIDKVVRDADGIFLLARLMMDILAPSSINNIRQIKKFLQASRCDLTNMYQETLTRIMSGDAVGAELARRMILWLCYSQRPLLESEIQHAMATEMDDEDFDPDGITPGDLLQDCCMGIVVCDSDRVYSLFHETAYDFFRNSPDFGSAAAHKLITKTCLCYLSFATMREQGPCQSLEALENRRECFSLLDYAAKHWGNHARQVESEVIDSIACFISDCTLRQCLAQLFYHRKRVDKQLQDTMFQSLPTGSTALQVACGWSLPETVNRLLAEDKDLRSLTQADDQGWTPMINASSYGHLEIVDLLLTYAADTVPRSEDDGSKDAKASDNKEKDVIGLNKADDAGWTPLFWAVVKGNLAMVEKLLNAGASASSKDESRWTPIDWAAFRADRSLVSLLMRYTWLPKEYGLFRHHRCHLRHPDEFSAIFLAAAAGEVQTVEQLIQRETTAPLSAGLPPGFRRALAKGKDERHAKSLYHNGNSNHKWISTPSMMLSVSFSIRLFESAIRFDQLAIVKMLVELGSPLGAVEGELKDRSALHIAACCGRRRICEYLIAQGADISLPDRDGYTPLDLAIMMTAIPCIKLFLEYIDPRTKVISRLIEDRTALVMYLRGWEHEGRLQGGHGRKTGDDLARDQLYPHVKRDSLHMLESSLFSEAQVPLVHCSVDGDATVLMSSHNTDHDEIALEILLDLLGHGCDVNATEKLDGDQPLHYACRLLNPKLVSFLLENGADANLADCYGITCLMTACSMKPVALDLVRILVEGGADVNAITEDPRSNCLNSALFNACSTAPVEVIRFLIASGAQVDTYNNYEQHPLHIICGRSFPRPATREQTIGLIEHVLDLSDPAILSKECCHDLFRGTRATVLDYAIQTENWAAVDLLCSRGAAAPNRIIASSSLLPHATNARGDTFQRLVQAGADVNAARGHGWWGQTALRGVVRGRMDVEFMRILLRHGAAVDPLWSRDEKERYNEMLEMLPEFAYLALSAESDDSTSEESDAVEENGYSTADPDESVNVV